MVEERTEIYPKEKYQRVTQEVGREFFLTVKGGGGTQSTIIYYYYFTHSVIGIAFGGFIALAILFGYVRHKKRMAASSVSSAPTTTPTQQQGTYSDIK